MSKEKLIPEFRFPEFKDSGEWDVKTLGEVLIKNSKKNKNQKYSQVESVSNKFGFIKQDEYFKNRRVASKDTSNYYVIKKGYFAYNPSRIDVGSLAYKHNDEISIISPLYVSFKANNELINDYFLLSFFNSVTFTKQMIFEGGVRNTLNYDNLIQSKIPIPTIQEQQRIASCLSSLDEVIEAHSKKLELLKDHKKGLLQNLFPQEGETVPKLRFPEFEGDGEWDTKTLDELGELVNGLTYSPKDVRNEGLLVLRSSNIQNGIIDFNDCVYVRSDIKGANLSRPKDILICVRNGSKRLIGKNAIIPENIPLATHGAFMTVFRASNPDFVFQLFQSDAYDRQVKADLGATINSINGKNFIKYEFAVPSNPQEQQKIASCLSAVDELITAQQEKIDELQQHKKGLMQGLFPKIND